MEINVRQRPKSIFYPSNKSPPIQSYSPERGKLTFTDYCAPTLGSQLTSSFGSSFQSLNNPYTNQNVFSSSTKPLSQNMRHSLQISEKPEIRKSISQKSLFSKAVGAGKFVPGTIKSRSQRQFQRQDRRSQLDSEQENTPKMLKEYSYRTSATGNSLFKEGPNNENREIQRMSLFSMFGANSPIDSQHRDSINSSMNSATITSKSYISKSIRESDGERSFASRPDYSFPSMIDEISESNFSVVDVSSDEEETINTERMRLRKILKKGFYALYFIGIMCSLRNRVQIYGALRPKEHFNNYLVPKEVEKKKRWFPISPTSYFSLCWTLLIVVFLLTTAVLTPVYVSFAADDNQFFFYVNNIIDLGFGIDIILNFITAYYDEEHKLVVDFRRIVFNYMKAWFWIDISSILPFDEIIKAITADQYSTNRANKLLKLLRFPRLYRMLKIFRLIKMLKIFSKNTRLNKILKKLNLNIGLIKFLKLIVNFVFIHHVVGCLWFFIARLDDFGPDTWVSRNDLVNESSVSQYISSIYWAFMNVTSVGYGDLVPITGWEKIITNVWMVVGVAVYSLTVADLTAILFGFGSGESLESIIGAFNNFSNEVHLPPFLRQKIRRFFELNHKESSYSWIDKKEILKNLPANLRTSLLLFSYYSVIKNIKILQVNANFTASLLTHFKFLKLIPGEILYREDDPATEIYFISSGSVNFINERSQGIFCLKQGTYFGETELLEGLKRKSFCQAQGQTVLLVCPKEAFLKVLKEFPEMETQIRKIMQMRKEYLEKQLQKIQQERRKSRAKIHQNILLKKTLYVNHILLRLAIKNPTVMQKGKGGPRSSFERRFSHIVRPIFLRSQRKSKRITFSRSHTHINSVKSPKNMNKKTRQSLRVDRRTSISIEKVERTKDPFMRFPEIKPLDFQRREKSKMNTIKEEQIKEEHENTTDRIRSQDQISTTSRKQRQKDELADNNISAVSRSNVTESPLIKTEKFDDILDQIDLIPRSPTLSQEAKEEEKDCTFSLETSSYTTLKTPPPPPEKNKPKRSSPTNKLSSIGNKLLHLAKVKSRFYTNSSKSNKVAPVIETFNSEGS